MDHYKNFLSSNSEKKLKEYRTKGDDHWKKVGEKMAIDLFKDASRRVPAYKDFLQKHKVNASKIRNIDDFKTLPLMDKENYINKYKLNELCWDGKVETSYLMSASSGSTGIPNFWPRSMEQTAQGASISELIYKDIFEGDKKSTLYIVAFAMGMWIAGTYMMMSTEWVAQKGYPITIATPGTNKDEIFRIIKMGERYYDQIIIIGYPPFIKDTIDTGIVQGINWKKINIKFMFSGEAITERWREHLSEKVGIKDIENGSINIYGSADVGLVAHETPLTTHIRRLSYKNNEIMKNIFGAERIPSLNQYEPKYRYFEKVGEELVITAPSGIPLVRYNTKDIGDVMYFEEASTKLKKYGQGLTDKKYWRLPMVYLFGRGKFTAVIYGANVYPEHVRLTLESKEIEERLTGKFVIITEERKDTSQELNLHVELSEKVQKSENLSSMIKKVFISQVSSINSEYKYVLDNFGDKVHPKVILHEYGDPEYFPRGVIKKNA